MSLNERIKEVRVSQNLSREAFAARMGLSYGALANAELGRAAISDSTVKLICLTFGVSEHWLRTGEGEMYEKVPADLVDQLAQEHHLGIGGRALLKAMTRAFLELDEPTQERLFQTVWNIMQNELLDSGPTDEEFFGTDASSSDDNELSS